MKTYQFSNIIPLNQAEVISIMYDLEGYNNWNRSLQYRSGILAPGAHLNLSACLDGQKMIKWSCKVDNLNENGFVLSKSMLFKGYMHMKHHFITEPIGENKCKVIHRWSGTGIATWFFWDKITKVLDKFKPYNESLIEHVTNINKGKV